MLRRALPRLLENLQMNAASDLSRIYAARFSGADLYRQRVWRVLVNFFSRWIPPDAAVLDLGCGHCEFINALRCSRRFGMDLNPDSVSLADAGVRILQQDCSAPWALPVGSLDVVFTSNFFEHLPTKAALMDTLRQAHRSLRPGGRLICLGPNIKYLAGDYWDFIDHYIPLSHVSLCEALRASSFQVEVCFPRFLPYTMSNGREHPIAALRLYLAMPFAWRFFGKQFLIVGRKP